MGPVIGAAVERIDEPETEVTVAFEVAVTRVMMPPEVMPLESTVTSKTVVTALVPASSSEKDHAAASRVRLVYFEQRVYVVSTVSGKGLVDLAVGRGGMDRRVRSICGNHRKHQTEQQKPRFIHGLPRIPQSRCASISKREQAISKTG
jgi:hypothetical protein